MHRNVHILDLVMATHLKTQSHYRKYNGCMRCIQVQIDTMFVRREDKVRVKISKRTIYILYAHQGICKKQQCMLSIDALLSLNDNFYISLLLLLLIWYVTHAHMHTLHTHTHTRIKHIKREEMCYRGINPKTRVCTTIQ